MKKHIYIFVLAAFLFSLAMPTMAMTSSAATTMTAAAPNDKDKAKAKAQAQKEKEKAKKQKEKEKQQAAKQKEADKKKAEAEKRRQQVEKERAKKQEAATEARAKQQKEAAKKQEQQQKEAAKKEVERQRLNEARLKEAEKREQEEAAREEAIARRWARSQKEQAKHLFNISPRVGYAALMDQQAVGQWGAINQGQQLGNDYAYRSLKGGAGAGLRVGYELEYKAFRFETGIDFDFLNSTSAYAFNMDRTEANYGAKYNYLFDNMRETRNAGYVGVPLMFGAQFDKFYFLLGGKVCYGFPLGNYSQKGQYDITVDDPALLEPYGLGIFDIPAQTKDQHPISFKQPDVRLCAEIGLDLDEWLHRDADPKDKKKKKVKEGERQPFGREYVHYKMGLFAEYGILNTNATATARPVEVATNDYQIQRTNTMLGMEGTKLNTLFVGVRFAIQFQVPGRMPETPSSYADIQVLDSKTHEPIPNAVITISDVQTEKALVRNKKLAKGDMKQKSKFGNYSILASAENYKSNTTIYTVDTFGHLPVAIYLEEKPFFRVTVSDKETGMPLIADVKLRKRGTDENRYTLTTDSVNGASSERLADSVAYSIHIEQFGYEPYNGIVSNLGDSMHIDLIPIKQEVIILKNMFFATNKTKILPMSEPELNGLYNFLESHPNVRIKIVGHTDSVGKDEANQKLSEGRAEAVMKDLIKRGIAPERLEAEGRGETEPIDTNDTEEGRQNNRRVEIHIL